MPINFTQLFQDSWNFVHNQRQFVIAFIVIFMLATGGLSLLPQAAGSLPELEKGASNAEITQAMIEQSVSVNGLFSLLIKQVVSLFIATWGIAAVHKISQGEGFQLARAAQFTASRFIGVLLLSLFTVLPLFVGITDGMMQLALQQAPSLLSLFLIIAGTLLFVRLCLAPVSYLVGDSPFKSAVQDMLKLGVKRSSTLFLYCLISYFFLPLISLQVSSLASNFVFFVVALVLIAFINVFSLVFTYRFYTQFKQKAA